MSVFTQMFLFQSLEDYGQPEAVRVWWCRQKSSLPTIRETMKMTEIITASPPRSEPDRLAIRVQATRSDGSGFECSTSRFVARVSYANCGKTPPGPNLREGLLFLAARLPTRAHGTGTIWLGQHLMGEKSNFQFGLKRKMKRGANNKSFTLREIKSWLLLSQIFAQLQHRVAIVIQLDPFNNDPNNCTFKFV